jgi:hypothetical protein
MFHRVVVMRAKVSCKSLTNLEGGGREAITSSRPVAVNAL